MSSSEDVFTAHNSSSSYSQHNGDILLTSNSRPGRATMENIKSVHDNPFYKNFGIRHSAQSYPRQVIRSEAVEQARQISSNGRSSSVDDDIGEYRPGSGYVHKLLDKFSSLTAREEHSVAISHLKRSSSLDELPVENEAAADKHIVSRATGIGYEKPSYLSVSKLSHRARSIESLNHSHHKPHQSFAVSLRHVETKWETDKHSVTSMFQRDSHVMPPDVELARDDIIIIENTSVAQFKDFDEIDNGTPIVVGNREVIIQDELPKPNTVLTVRSIFESASSGSGLYTRRQKSDSPLSLSSLPVKPILLAHVSAASHDGASNRVSLHSPSPVTSPRLSSDTYTRPGLLPSSSRSEVLKSPAPTASSSSRANLSRSVLSSQQAHSFDDSPMSPTDLSSGSAADGKLFSFDTENSLDATGYSDNLHLANALYNSVKPAVIGKSGYRNLSPLASGSSLKERLEDDKKDDLPVMIFTRSNLSPKRVKPQRTKDYTPLSDVSYEIKNEETDQRKDVINPNEVKKNFEADDNAKSADGTSNKISSHRRFFDSSSKAADTNVSDQSKKTYTKQPTTLEIKSTKSALGREQLPVKEKSKHAENEAELKPRKKVTFGRTSVAKSRIVTFAPTIQLEHESIPLVTDESHATYSLTSKAQPVEEKHASYSPHSISSSEESIPEIHKEKTGLSKRSYPNDAPAVNEQPLSKVSKDKPDSKEQPVKGIPSIIAQRLKNQNSDPSQVAEDVTSLSVSANSFTEEEEESSDGSILSRRHPIPTSPKSLSSDNNERDSLGSEIENEIAAVRKKMEGTRSKSAGHSPIFDSSQLTKKWKEKKQQAAASQGLVPPLDLSGITVDQTMEYQPQQKSIAPCNIVFIGENAQTSRSLLVKQRKVKDHHCTQTTPSVL